MQTVKNRSGGTRDSHMLFWPGCCCPPSTHILVVTVRSCGSTGGPLGGVTIRLKQAGVTLFTEGPTSGSGTVTFLDVAPGDYQITTAHASYNSGAETSTDFTMPDANSATDILMTLCGSLPDTLYLSSTDGASNVPLHFTTSLGLSGPGYAGDWFLPRGPGDTDPPSNNRIRRGGGGCVVGDIVIRVRFEFYCSGGGYQLTRTWQYQNSLGSPFLFHYEDSEKALDDPTRCPSNGQPMQTQGNNGTGGGGTCTPFVITSQLERMTTASPTSNATYTVTA